MMQVGIVPRCLDGFDLVRRAGDEPAFPTTGTGVLLLDDRRVSKLHRQLRGRVPSIHAMLARVGADATPSRVTPTIYSVNDTG